MILGIIATSVVAIMILWVYIWLLKSTGSSIRLQPFLIVTLLIFPMWLALGGLTWGLYVMEDADLQLRAIWVLILLAVGSLGINRIIFSNSVGSPDGSAEAFMLYLLMAVIFVTEIVLLCVY
jgi:hypothetical protein